MANDLERLHEIELDLLKRFIKICDDNGIQYFIIGGSLIGAVRHGGFIPWDDDIDIAVPRNDYDRLIEVMHKTTDGVIGLEYYKDNPDLYFYPIRITHKAYRIKEPRNKDGYANPWIDILPIDGLPDNKIARKILKTRMMFYRLLLGLHYVDNLRTINRSGVQRIIISIGKVSKVGTLVDPTVVKDKITKVLSANNMGNCLESGTCMGAYFFHEFVKTEYFGRGSKVTFENIEVNAPEKVHEYLTHMYGDYMKLPPKEKQIAHGVTFEDAEEY